MKPITYFLIILLLTRFSNQGYCQKSSSSTSHIPESALLLSSYIQKESVTGNEKQAGEFLAAQCRQKGLHIQLFSDKTNSYNFAASLFPLSSQKPNIILLNHIDVVPAGNVNAWTHPPFSGKIQDGMVWGRGAVDIKGYAIMQMLAIASLRENIDFENYPFNVTLLCVSQEEHSGPLGAQLVVNNYLEVLNPAVVFGEGGIGVSGILPRDTARKIFCISVAEKRALWLKLHVKVPTSGHGSIPPNEYANKTMVAALTKLTSKKQKIRFTDSNEDFFESLGGIEKGLKGFILKNAKLFRPIISSELRKDPKVAAIVTNTITLTNLSNPEGATNQIAQEVTASLDCRLLPETDTDEFIEKIRNTFRKQKVNISIELETINGKASGTDNNFYQQFRLAINKVYPDVQVMPYLFPAYTDNSYFRNKGIPVYGIVPIHLPTNLIEAVHNSDERIPIESMELGIQVLKVFLRDVMNNSSQLTSLK